MSWRKIHTPKRKGSSHKLFKDENGRVSICDWSGGSPDTTDDGPLIVEPGTIVTTSIYEGALAFHVPVVSTRESRGEGVVWVDEECMRALWLVEGLGLRFDRDASFRKLEDSVFWAMNLPSAYG